MTAGTELAKAYVQIIPSATGIQGAIQKELGGEAESAGRSAGGKIAGAIKNAIAAAAIGETVKHALEAGGALQQSYGGLETIYGEAAQEAKAFAAEAVKAGISANDYAEQAVSFGAALRQAYGGDLQAAARAADTAILDMADNSAKMGTDIASIQNAYQGFAKQNYTMLDNLKLGYGGTKQEMQRLLADAEKLTGIKYDIDNLGDVYNAIHAIQEDLGLTGVAAKEASETFSGSLAAMKAAGENLLANLTLGEDIQPALDVLGETVEAFLLNNLTPMLLNIIKGLPDALKGAITAAVKDMDFAANNADEIVAQGIELVTTLIKGLGEATPQLAAAGVRLVLALIKALITNLPGIAEAGLEMVAAFAGAIIGALGEVGKAGDQVIKIVKDKLTGLASSALQWGRDLLSNFIQGIKDKLSGLKDAVAGAAQTVKDRLGFSEPEMGPLSDFHTYAPDMVDLYAKGIKDNLPVVRAASEEMAQAIRNASLGEGTDREISGALADGLRNGWSRTEGADNGQAEVVAAIYAAAHMVVDELRSGGTTDFNRFVRSVTRVQRDQARAMG